jgi:hypothetical protein
MSRPGPDPCALGMRFDHRRGGNFLPHSSGYFVSISARAHNVAPMNFETLGYIGWAVVFVFVGAIVGTALVLVAAAFVPRLIDRLTPNIDEGREIARGNTAVAQYFGLICGASIIGLSLVIAAAVLGGIIAALH